MLEILAKRWSFLLICWFSWVNMLGWLTYWLGTHHDLQNLGRKKFGIRALGSSVSKVQEQCLVESCGLV